MTKPFIALDWGTTSFRAYHVDTDGTVLESRADAEGILAVKDGGFDAVLEKHISDWDKSVPIIASGMITSRQGWVECPYVDCPAAAEDLAKSIRTHKTSTGRTLHFITGLHYHSPTIEHDVLRGEETQVFGALASGATHFITPGTHSKWISVSGGQIVNFATYMTGESFALFRNHSILGRLMKDGPHDAAAFSKGVSRATQTPADILHTLFSVRSLGLFNAITPECLASYLSGLLIGCEIASAVKHHQCRETYLVLGSPSLAANYVAALKLIGLNVQTGDPLCAIQGQRLIAQHAGII
ncbi:MAG: 2-dehydro-3-deoxygalactonokinase [Alphaproteobacteria bacterium]|nr:2-dehydro-3-deoxygalactonokinase [Alphaproteobacteria bacterium]